MKLYIDLENLKSLANNQDSEIMRLIKENFDVFYTFDEQDIKKEKRQKIVKIENWQKNLSSGRMGKGVCYNAILPSFCEEDNGTWNPKDELQSLFLIKENSIIPNGLIASRRNDGCDALRNLLIENKCVPAKFYYTRPEKGKEIQKWEIVSKNVSPCTDIIINDLYMFAQSDTEYGSNSYKLIEELCKRSVGQKLNIVIVTRMYFNMNKNKKQKDGSIKTVSVPYSILTNSIIRNIKRIAEEVTNCEANVTIIAQRDEHSDKRIHDRTIFTNYKLFISGDSFKYYRDKVDDNPNTTEFISHGLWFGVCSLFDDEHRKIAKRFLDDIQEIIDESRKIDESPNTLTKTIYGDRESNFLTNLK